LNSKELAKKIIKGHYPILDPSYVPDWEPFRLAEEILAQGHRVLQLRCKTVNEADYKALAEQIYYLKIHNDFSIILNHHVQVVQDIDADGVHLTAESVSVSEARCILGKGKVIGQSVHSIEEGIQAEKEGVDYLTLGAIFETPHKQSDHPIQGIENLKTMVESVSIPVVAIGGIDESNKAQVMDSGCAACSGIRMFIPRS